VAATPEGASDVRRPGSAPAAGLPAESVDDLRAVEESLCRFRARHASRIGAAARHLLDAGGKRLRPLLSCATARALGHDPRPQIDLVAAVELVHAGSLLHDDVIDGAELRRGRRAAHAEFDAHTAILAGDFLFSWAFDRLARDGSRELQIAMGDAIRNLCEGEVLERERRFDATADLAHARLVNRLKTAELFAYAAEAGTLLAGADESARGAARAYGLALGEAFQTVDDLLDWAGDAAALGKPPGQDLAEGLVTVPAALGLERDPELRGAIRAAWDAAGGDGGRAADEVRGRLERCGAFAAARAGEALAGLPAGPWRDRLAQAARAAVSRDR
jgi:octaprenyl-diphosphate synthase